MSDVDFDEKAFDMIGPNAPQEVKDAWMEAAAEALHLRGIPLPTAEAPDAGCHL